MVFKQSTKWIRQFDTFGHPVTLNFNKKGDAHQTTLGGLLSLAMYVVLIRYLILNFIDLINRKDPNINFQKSTVNLAEDIGAININEEGLLLFVTCQSMSTFLPADLRPDSIANRL